MSYPKVYILILNWNGYKDTIECLESLKKITYPNYEIIVVDNASSGDDVKILREQYGNYIHIIENDQNYGFPEGSNIGMKYALSRGADYILWLNNDTVVDPVFLDELMKISESDPSIGMTGSKLYEYYTPNRIQCAGGKIIFWLGIIWTYGRGEDDVGQHDTIAERDFVWGTSMLIKRAVIEKISFLDPYYFFGLEEYDYCTRTKRAGFKIVYVPKSKVWHKFGASRAKLPQFPETQALIKRLRGFQDYKYYYRFFRSYCPPVLFIFPTIIATSMIGVLLELIGRGHWGTIWGALTRRVRSLLRVPNKSRLPH